MIFVKKFEFQVIEYFVIFFRCNVIEDGMKVLVILVNGDMRKVLNIFQVIFLGKQSERLIYIKV